MRQHVVLVVWFLSAILFGLAGYFFAKTQPLPLSDYRFFSDLNRIDFVFARPENTFQVDKYVCDPSNCSDWNTWALYASQASSREICDFYLEKLLADNWESVTQQNCSDSSLQNLWFTKIGKESGIVIGLVIQIASSESSHNINYVPVRFIQQAQELGKTVYKVRFFNYSKEFP